MRGSVSRNFIVHEKIRSVQRSLGPTHDSNRTASRLSLAALLLDTKRSQTRRKHDRLDRFRQEVQKYCREERLRSRPACERRVDTTIRVEPTRTTACRRRVLFDYLQSTKRDTRRTLARGVSSAPSFPLMSSDRLLKPAFRREEEWLAEQCSQVGSPYKGPSAFEDKKETEKRRKRLRYAIDKLKDPAAHAAKLADRRFGRQRKRCSDRAGHEAFKEDEAARLRSRRSHTPTPSKRRRNDIVGESTAFPDGGEAMDIDGELRASPDRGKAAGDGAKADDEPDEPRASSAQNSGAGSRRYKFMDFVEGTKEQSVDEQIRKAERDAKKFDQRFRLGESNKFKVPVCAVCDRLIIGTAKCCFIAKEDIKSKADRIGCASYESHYGDGSLPDILKKQYAIANGFVIGHLPKKIEYEKDGAIVTVDVPEALTSDVLCAILSPKRPFAFCISYFGGAHKSVRGHVTFFETDLSHVGEAASLFNRPGANPHIYCVLCGRMTKDQKELARKKAALDTEKLMALLTWYKEKSGHPAYANIVLPTTEFAAPTVIEDPENEHNTDKSGGGEVAEVGKK
ncbi:hypothetical protein THAOC_02790, partial [Thalassiosira oceanica]